MQLRTSNVRVRHIEPPLLRGRSRCCPRCGGLLVYDHEDFACVTCGYEFPRWGQLDEPRDAEPGARDVGVRTQRSMPRVPGSSARG